MILHYGGARNLISRGASALAIVRCEAKGPLGMPDLSKNPLAKTAADLVNREARVLVLSESDVIGLLDLRELLDGLADGFKALAAGRVQTPERPAITVPGQGFSLAMPAWMAGKNITVKIVNVFEGNLASDLPNHIALITLFDPTTGMPVCVMDGTCITGVRTAGS